MYNQPDGDHMFVTEWGQEEDAMLNPQYSTHRL